IQGLKTGDSVTDTVLIHSVDGNSQKVTVTINGTDDKAVIAGTSTASLTEDKDLHSGISSQELRVDGALTVTDVDNGQNQFQAESIQGQFGTLSINNLGHWIYTADNSEANIQGLKTGDSVTDTVIVHSADGTKHSITVTVNGTNDGPVLNTITAATATEGDNTATTGTITSTDMDTGDSAVYTTKAAAAGFTLNTDGSYTFDSTNAVYNGLAQGDTHKITIPVTVTDASGASDQKDLVITVTGSNDKPALDSIQVQNATEDGSQVTGTITSTDVDAHETAAYTAPNIDGFSLDPTTGAYTFDPSHAAYQHLASGQDQTVTIPVTVTDQNGGTDTQNLVITVHGTADSAVIAGTDTGSTTEETQLQAAGTLTITDKDAGQDHFQSGNIAAVHGTLHLKANGSWTYDLDNSNKDVQALGTGKAGTTSSLTDIIEVKGADGTSHHITVTVNGTNDGPVLNTITAATATEGDATATTGTITSTDTDTGDSAVYTTAATPAGFTLNTDGSYTFDPSNVAYNGLAEGDTQKITIPVTVTDGSGGTDQKDLVITVTGTNDKPVLGAITAQSATEDGATVTGTITSTDVDAHETAAYTAPNVDGFSLEPATGAYTFDPSHSAYQHLAAGQDQTVTIPVTVTDQNGGTDTKNLVITVHGKADAAVISGVDTGNITEDKNVGHSSAQTIAISGSLVVTDPDARQDHFQYSQLGEQAIHDPFHGSLHITPQGNWGYSVKNSALQYLHEGDVEHVVYRVHSADGTSHDITITVTGTNDAPVLAAQTQSVIEDGSALQGQMQATDVDYNSHSMLSFAIANPVDGLSFNTDGSYTFDPAHASYQHLGAGQEQTITIPVTVTDEANATSTQNLTITVHGTNDAAVIGGTDTGDLTEDITTSNNSLITSGHLTVSDNDTNESIFQVSGTGNGAQGVRERGSLVVSDTGLGSYRMHANGEWDYIANNQNPKIQSLAANEVLRDTITVHSADGTTHDIVITINGTNDAPTVTSHVLAGTEDTAHTFTANEFGFTDVDSGAALDHISITALPDALEGVLTLNGVAVATGDNVTTADIGHLVFTPAANFNGVANFGYTVNDGSANSAPATMQLNVASTNDISVISGDTSGTLNEGNIGDTTTATGHLAITDVDVTDTPTFPDVASTATTYGHIAMVNGQWKYTVDQSKIQDLDPNDNDATKHQVIDHHTFTASDGSTQVVDIVIKGTNDKPIIESAHAAPAGSSNTLKIDDFEMVSTPTGANIDVAPTDAENAARWGADQVEVGVGMKLVGLYKPGSDQNWIQSGHEATITTGHSGAGGYSMIDSHGWWAANHVPDAVNTGSGGSTGHGNAWTGGIAVFQAPDGTQHIGIVNRVCGGGGSTEHDYLYFHSYANLHPGASIIKGQGTAGETITVKDDQGHTITTAVVDTHGHWEVAAAALGNGQHTLHIENAAGQSSPDRIYDISGNTVADNTPAGLTADIKEDTAHTVINGELRTSDADHGDNPAFVAQADHTTQYGHFSIDTAGKYHYTIDNNNTAVNHLGVNQSIQEHITVTAKTADGEVATHDVVITINGSVDAPTLSASAATAQQGSLIALNLQAALTDTGGDAETLTLKISGLPDTATLNHGTYDSVAKYWVLHASDLNDLKVDMKDPNFHGDLHFNVTATATSGGESESTTQSVSLHVNAPPVIASAIMNTETEGATAATIDLLQGATDPDNAALSIASVTYAVGSGASSATLPAGVTLGSDGHTLTIDPSHATFNHLAAGTSESIAVNYQVTDGSGGSVNQTATLTVTGTNDAAIFGGVATGSVTDQTGLSATGQLTVTDVDTGQSNFQAATGLTGTHGTLDIDASGHWTYSLNTGDATVKALTTNSRPITDHVAIASADGSTKIIDITIQGTNDTPTITTVALTGSEDKDYTFSASNFGFTDVDTGDTLAHVTITNLPDPTEGLLLLNGVAVTANQDIDNADINLLTFKPTANFNGDVHFKYTVNDGSVDSTEATGTLTVASVNDATKVVGTISATTEDTDITITKAQLLAGATDADGDTLDINSVSVNGSHGTITDNKDGTWTLHPDTNFKGDIALSYNVNDGHANVANHMTVGVSSVTDAADISLSVSSDKGWMTDSGHHLSIDALHNPDGSSGRDGGTTLTIELGITLDKSETYHNSDVIAQYGTHLSNSADAQLHCYSDGSAYGGKGVTLTNPHSVTIWVAGMDPVETHIDLTDGKPHRLTVVVDNDNAHGKVPTTSIFDNGQPVHYAGGTSSESMPLHELGGSGSNEHYHGFLANGNEFDTEFTYGGGNTAVPKFIAARAGSTELSVGGGRNPISLGDGTHANGYENGHIIWQAGSTDHGGNVPPITPLVATFDHVSVSKTALTAAQVAHGPLGELGLSATEVIIDLGVAGGKLVDHSGHNSATNFGSQQIADNPNHLTINAAVTPHDADDALQSVLLHGLPIGTTVSDGTHTHTIDATDQKDGLDIKDWKLGSLDVQIPTGVNHNAIITVNAVTQNADGTTAHSESSAPIILDPAHVGDIIISAPPIHGVEDQGPYNLNLTAIDLTDTHAAITFAVSGLPAGATLSAGSYDSNTKTWTITPSEVNGLQITLPKDFNGSFDPHVVATSSRTDGSHQSANADGRVNVAAVDDAATFTGDDKSTEIHEDNTNHLYVSGHIIHSNEHQLVVHDPDAGENFIVSTGKTTTNAQASDHGQWVKGDGGVGEFVVNANGKWDYKIDNTNAVVQSLKSGEKYTDTITVHSKDGTSHTLTVEVAGTDDKPTITVGTIQSVTEDGTATATGTVATTDVDTGDTATMTAITNQAGTYGHLTMGTDGQWTYTLDNSSAQVQGLIQGQTETDTFTVTSTSTDGSVTTEQLVINVTGKDDAAVISGTDSDSTLIEDQHLQSGKLLETNQHQLTSIDVDGTNNLFQPTGTSHGTGSAATGTWVNGDKGAGQFILHADGRWFYKIDNSASVVQGLKSGETFEETLTIHSADGTAHTLTVHVNGSNDGPTITAIAPNSTTEDGAVYTGQIASTDLDTGDTATYSTASTQGGFTLNANGSYKLDPTDASFQHLKAGEIETLTIPVTVTDSAGATDTKDLVITITGTNDMPTINGVDTVTLKEDIGANPQSHELTATGKLDITDVDTGESSFISHGFNKTALQGSYGHLQVSPDGGWSYSTDNTQTAIQALGAGDKLTDTITVTSKDGTTHDIVITINGTNDAPTISGADTGAVTEDVGANSQSHNLSVTGKLGITDVDTGESSFEY
ncbi:VCBS domain-containing protein, partial [Shewanella olleyana]|uniref:VCBS domain-containing protein n=1 Tax=Shewanella olleyana TaxID=135626 RepID=UPI00200C7BB5